MAYPVLVNMNNAPSQRLQIPLCDILRQDMTGCTDRSAICSYQGHRCVILDEGQGDDDYDENKKGKQGCV